VHFRQFGHGRIIQYRSRSVSGRKRDDLLYFIAHGAHTLAGRVIRCGYRQKDANGCTVIFFVLPAFNLNPATVVLNELLCDKQADAWCPRCCGL